MKMMAKANVSFSFLCFLLSIVVCTSSRYTTTVVAGEKRGRVATGNWCIARYGEPPNPTDAELKRATDYCCAVPGVDCSIIRDGQPCSFAKKDLTTIQTQASVVLNLYYRAYHYCPDVDFFVNFDPSYNAYGIKDDKNKTIVYKGRCTFQ